MKIKENKILRSCYIESIKGIKHIPIDYICSFLKKEQCYNVKGEDNLYLYSIFTNPHIENMIEDVKNNWKQKTPNKEQVLDYLNNLLNFMEENKIDFIYDF
jgi:hypothetical protein